MSPKPWFRARRVILSPAAFALCGRWLVIALGIAGCSEPDRARHRPLERRGPLVVSSANSRYFAVESNPDKAVYLTGSHLWNNLQDGVGFGSCDEPGPPFDFTAYLDFLEAHGHNFIRLWRWEHSKFKLPADLDTGGPYCVSPQPWPRSGPDGAWDGGRKFDLSAFDQSYFDRLRARVIQAGHRGLYVSVMLFDGFCLHLCDAETRIAGHPFERQNNVSDIDIDSIDDYQSSKVALPVLELQQAYVRKVIDTVHDLDNVLYEVANESVAGSTEWQYSVIEFVKQYEAEMGYEKHPAGMSAEPGEQESDVYLFAGPADWVAPGTYPAPPDRDYDRDPPASDGTKVVLSDNDHYLPCETTPVWAWKSLVRGLNPLNLDCGLGDPQKPVPVFEFLESTRNAMGDTLLQASSMDLMSMEPHGELTTTGYALANPGVEYLVLQPGRVSTVFTVHVSAGSYAVDWFSIEERTRQAGEDVRLDGDEPTRFSPPFTTSGPTVLHLRAR